MTRQFILIAFLFLTQLAFGQKHNLANNPAQPPTQKELKNKARNHNCIKRFSKTFKTRITEYPFNQTSRIEFVSFKGSVDTIDKEILRFNDSLPRLNDTICYSKLYERQTLNLNQIESLTDILFNYGFAGQTYTMSMAGCYNPRNAILFIDNTGKTFEFIEICFECSRTRKSSEKISLGQMCDQKLEMLKNLFKTVGIEYGITKGLILD
jgi:hypothetical protein